MSDINRVTPSALRLYEIDAARAHEEVVDQIVYAIRSGLLQTGDLLPTIEDLAESTGVSKPVVGEAVRVLREHGVVTSKRGVQGGVTVITDDVPMAVSTKDAAKHIRRQAGELVAMNRLPAFHFKLDSSLKKQAGVIRAIAMQSRADTARNPAPPDTAQDDTQGTTP